jgi:glycosyltransferase involved in cell wall biosynthesis
MTTLPGLAERGHEFMVLTSQAATSRPEHAEHDGIRIRRLPFWSALKKRDVSMIAGIKAQVVALQREFAPDLLHIDFSGYTAFFQAATAHRMSLPTVLALHSDLSGMRATADTALCTLLETADWVTGVSQATLDSARAIVPTIAGRSSVIFGCPPNWAPVPAMPGAVSSRVLAIGRLSREKGFDLLIEAAAKLRSRYPSLEVRIIGEGPERGSLEQYAQQLGVRDRVFFVGSVAHQDLPRQIAEAQVVVVPSRVREAFGMTAVEAAILERPVIATNAGGLREVVVHGETGLLVEMDDAGALAEALDRVLGDRRTAEGMGKAARARVVREFSLSRRVDAYDRLYRRLAAGAAQTV